MAERTGRPPDASAPDAELALWVDSAEMLRSGVAPSYASELDYTWHSLRTLDRVLDEATRSGIPLSVRTRLGLAAYVGELLVRQFGGTWATGECYGEVMAPPWARLDPDRCAASARPTDMVERRLRERESLQRQVFEQIRAWGIEPGGNGHATGDSPAVAMRLAAEVFVKTGVSRGVTWLDYSADSVARLDGLLGEWWPDTPAEGSEALTPSIGAYLGEVLAMDTGARWVRDAGRGFGLELDGQVVFPSVEVARRLQAGPSAPVGQFFDEVSIRWHLAGEEKTTSRDRAGQGRRGGGPRGRGRG
jgi:hypothetical protein